MACTVITLPHTLEVVLSRHTPPAPPYPSPPSAPAKAASGGPAAAAAGPPQVPVSAAAADGAAESCRPLAANPAPLSFGATSCGVGEAASVAAPGPGGPPSGARTSLETLMTPAAAAPATPELDERGRPCPSPASGERPPGSKRVRHGQDMQGVAKALDYVDSETPAAARAMPPPGIAPAAEPSVTVEPQSLRLAASRPRDDGTPPQAPPKKRPARDIAAAAQGQQAAPALQLGYAAHSRGYCISFGITWRNAESTEHDRLAARHAIRQAITTWGARQPLGCMAVGKSRTDGLDFHIYGIHGFHRTKAAPAAHAWMEGLV